MPSETAGLGFPVSLQCGKGKSSDKRARNGCFSVQPTKTRPHTTRKTELWTTKPPNAEDVQETVPMILG